MSNENNAADNAHQRLVISSVIAATFMAVLDSYIVNISLPTIAQTFNISTSIVSRVIIVYLLVLISTLLLFGKMGDRFGLKKVLCFGYICFSAGSLFCGLATTINLLIAARCLQGIGAAMLIAMAAAIVAKHLPVEKRGAAYGLLSAASSLAITIGAPLGGFITAYLSWRWIFFVNVPIGLAACLIAMRALPAVKPSQPLQSFDLAGAALVFCGLSCLLYALNMGQERGWASAIIAGSFIAAIIFLVLFIMREKMISYPLADLNLFRNKYFLLAVLGTFFAYMLLAGSMFLLPFYLINLKGLQSNQAGLVFIFYSLIKLAAAPPAGHMSDIISPRRIACFAILMAAFSSFLFAFTFNLQGLFWVAVLLFLQGIAYGFFISPMTNLSMSWAPEGSQGITAATYTTISNLGLVVGVCVFETIFSLALPAHFMLSKSAPSPEIKEMMTGGFFSAFLFGGFICLISFAFTFFSRNCPKCSPNEKVFLH